MTSPKLMQSWHDCVLIRNSDRAHAAGMATLAQKIDCERRTREFLEKYDLPQPDHVEYGFTCIRLFFEPEKVVLVVDIDEPEDGEDPT
jgi:hypothetical protein